MKKIILISILLWFDIILVTAQWQDMNWLIGLEKEEMMIINFEGNNPFLSPFPCNLNFLWTNSVISNHEGSLQFFTNGIAVHNKNKELINNGDSLNFNDFTTGYMQTGYSTWNAITSLPDPGFPGRYYLFHRRVDTSAVYGIKVPDLLLTLVDMLQNNGSGDVLFKNQVLLHAQFIDGSTAVKHANGRDWWVVVSENNNNNYSKFLVTSNGILDWGFQTIGEKPPFDPPQSGDNQGQNLFSPDGTIYIEHDYISGTRIFNFNRCTGELSNFTWIQYSELISDGAAISPNSRFLYVASPNYIYQFDLWANDIATSKQTVAEYDGYNPLPAPLIVPFTSMQLAPDGRIYIQGPQFQIHTIYHPNLPGLACDLRQHDIITPEVIGVTWPHYPNYRLGPIDGSGCDTLDINNVPLAHFTWEADTIAPQWIRFTDNSFYEPTEWSWDYGDGYGSTEVNPDHSYATTGIYEVCLTVSNTYGSNTFCRDVEITTVGTDELVMGSSGLQIFPNPANESVTMNCQFPVVNAHYVLEVTDAVGRVWKEVALDGQVSNIVVNTGDFPAGVYYASVKNNGQVLGKGRFVVVK